MALAADPFVGRSIQQLAARSDDRARRGYVDAHRVRLAVAIARIGFDADQVIPGNFRVDAVEDRFGRPVSSKIVPRAAPASISSPSNCTRRSANGSRVIRALLASKIGFETEHVQRRARCRGQRTELDDHVGVGQHESFRHQDQRLRLLPPGAIP